MSEQTAPVVIFAPEPTVLDVQEQLAQEALIVSPEETSRRLSFCNGCEHNGRNEEDIPTCVACGCNLSMLTTLSFKSCPVNKWTL